MCNCHYVCKNVWNYVWFNVYILTSCILSSNRGRGGNISLYFVTSYVPYNIHLFGNVFHVGSSCQVEPLYTPYDGLQVFAHLVMDLY